MSFYLLLFHDSHCLFVITILCATVGVMYSKQTKQDSKCLKISGNRKAKNKNWSNKRYKNGQKLKLCLRLTKPHVVKMHDYPQDGRMDFNSRQLLGFLSSPSHPEALTSSNTMATRDYFHLFKDSQSVKPTNHLHLVRWSGIQCNVGTMSSTGYGTIRHTVMQGSECHMLP